MRAYQGLGLFERFDVSNVEQVKSSVNVHDLLRCTTEAAATSEINKQTKVREKCVFEY